MIPVSTSTEPPPPTLQPVVARHTVASIIPASVAPSLPPLAFASCILPSLDVVARLGARLVTRTDYTGCHRRLATDGRRRWRAGGERGGWRVVAGAPRCPATLRPRLASLLHGTLPSIRCSPVQSSVFTQPATVNHPRRPRLTKLLSSPPPPAFLLITSDSSSFGTAA